MKALSVALLLYILGIAIIFAYIGCGYGGITMTDAVIAALIGAGVSIIGAIIQRVFDVKHLKELIQSKSSQESVNTLRGDLEKRASQESVNHLDKIVSTKEGLEAGFKLVNRDMTENKDLLKEIKQYLSNIQGATTSTGDIQNAFSVFTSLVAENGKANIEKENLKKRESEYLLRIEELEAHLKETNNLIHTLNEEKQDLIAQLNKLTEQIKRKGKITTTLNHDDYEMER